MFDELIREIRRHEGKHQVPVSLPSDAEGYFDRECPSTECQFQFKVHEDDWRDKVRDEEVFCPFCRHAADSSQWWTQDQIKHAQETAVAHLRKRIHGAMKRDATRWNLQQRRDSFLRITMKVDDRPVRISVPSAAAEPMRLKITCPACACRYAVIGAAFFCPACGHNAADLMFSQSIAGIRQALDAQTAVREAIEDRDAAETMARLIVENGLQNAVTAFQRYAEVLYATFPSAPRPRRNAFQNLGVGSDLWFAATGKRYGDYLEGVELATLTRMFQQRHLLTHREGMVDADYLARSGDTAYREGQRLVIRDISVRECIELLEKLAASMAAIVAARSSEGR